MIVRKLTRGPLRDQDANICGFGLGEFEANGVQMKKTPFSDWIYIVNPASCLLLITLRLSLTLL